MTEPEGREWFVPSTGRAAPDLSPDQQARKSRTVVRPCGECGSEATFSVRMSVRICDACRQAPDFEAIRRRLEAATPGPWEADGSEIKAALYTEHGNKWIGETCRPDDPTAIADAQLIAHAPADLAALLAHIDRQQAEIDRLRDVAQALEEELAQVNAEAELWAKR